MKLKLEIHLNTDGDFGIRDIGGELSGTPLFDQTNPMYKDVEIGYDYKINGETIDITLTASGEADYQCQFAARDLMQNLVCRFEVLPSHYYLIDDLYHLVIDVKEGILFKSPGGGLLRNFLFGNYEGSMVRLEMTP